MLGTTSGVPQPEWGLPEGWGAYLAELFSWVLGRKVEKDEAMKCARRQPGRSWECVEQELHKLGELVRLSPSVRVRRFSIYRVLTALVLWPGYAGLYPERWQLPLRLKEVQQVNGSLQEAFSSGEHNVEVGAGRQPPTEESEGGTDVDDDTVANMLLGLNGTYSKVRDQKMLTIIHGPHLKILKLCRVDSFPFGTH